MDVAQIDKFYHSVSLPLRLCRAPHDICAVDGRKLRHTAKFSAFSGKTGSVYAECAYPISATLIVKVMFFNKLMVLTNVARILLN